MKYLYKYPQAEFPYGRLVEDGRRRGTPGPEYELLDTGVFDDDRYFDVVIEYAKAGPEDLCVRIEAFNRGPEAAPLHVLPHLWFRNTWAWGPHPLPEPVDPPRPRPGRRRLPRRRRHRGGAAAQPARRRTASARATSTPTAAGPCSPTTKPTRPRVYGPGANRTPYVKDAFHRHVIDGEDCVNPEQVGTKAAVHYAGVVVPAGGSVVFRLRLTDRPSTDPLADVDRVVDERRARGRRVLRRPFIRRGRATDERRVQRQALAGLLWTKQTYLFDVNAWLEGDNPASPPPESRKRVRNVHWRHLNSLRVMTLPDKWEYPWFAAWDLAFHCVPLALVDPDFAKEQLWLLLFEQFQHPNGQIPAYEWEFSDLNPPVHAWAVWRVYNMDRDRRGKGDRLFLEKCFHKLLINFAWWVNKVDREGNNVFEGGFLGLDNITVVDRSQELPPTARRWSSPTRPAGWACSAST